MKKTLALFDFDGTITTKDTFLEFIKYSRGVGRYYLGMTLMSPILVAFKLKLIPNWKAKEAVITYFFKNTSYNDFQNQCHSFSREVIPALLKKDAIEALDQHISNGDDVYLVSASAENWLKDWCEFKDIKLIGTKLEVVNGNISGKLNGHNCYGQEKVNRVRQVLDLEDYDKIFVYGDSSGDKQMLGVATNPHYRFFKG
ncbi:HAD-IB family hydrolase [Fulvivirga ligni]|uniref:HAD-IB family hydrolase n=1 Tax=Fulvivirga ligni TaxID=2904246 RepID=UPI001F3E3EAE|nr:HAD-IB family hydrolase [Fulvivirga ligni]UII19716.1 HAD-IB family hydrolase [Fulvivirga ligni]